jgi:cytochrome c551/c552
MGPIRRRLKKLIESQPTPSPAEMMDAANEVAETVVPAVHPAPHVQTHVNAEPSAAEKMAASLRSKYGNPATQPASPTTTLPHSPVVHPSSPQRDPRAAVPHVVVRARAGTGKTFTMVVGVVNMFRRRIPTLWDELVNRLGFSPEPSPQQARVWEQMQLSEDVRGIQFTAFNNSIVDDFNHKWGWLVQLLAQHGISFRFNTSHSLGYSAVRAAFPGLGKPEKNKTQELTARLCGVDLRRMREQQPVVLQATQKLVKLLKMSLTELTGDEAQDLEAMSKLVAHYNVEMTDDRYGRGNSYAEQVYRLAPQVLADCMDPRTTNSVDFDDMIWLPIKLGLPIQRVPLMLVDEGQDLNKAQHQLVIRSADRLVIVGDDRQAIYGFTGADCDSLPNLQQYLAGTQRGCVEVPLTVTRRCGKEIVKQAQRLVPDFEAHESNPTGVINRALYPLQRGTSGRQGDYQELPYEHTYLPMVGEGDMILCRVNAPLVSQCFQLLRRGKKAYIQGRDVGASLAKTVRDMEAGSVEELIRKITDWAADQVMKEQAKRNPSEEKVINITDRKDCILCFTDNCSTVDDVLKKIDDIFTDKDLAGVKLSSVHKAKGMEAHRVFLLMPERAQIPHPMAKTEWQINQEYNLLYVAITRAINELVYVT